MKKCDLVMKGGITSGVVYPGAVCELAKECEFANIGGTSAGAIAAALTAAAEFRRQEKGSAAGFEELAGLPEWLAGTSDGRSRLLALFQPSEETAPMFEVIVRWVETPGTVAKKVWATLRALVGRFNRFGGVVLAVGAIVALIVAASGFLLRDRSPLLVVGLLAVLVLVGALTAAGFVVAAAIEAAVRLLRELPKGGFGLCRGMSEGNGDGLTDWLDREIGNVGGIDAPLTFGDLDRHGINLEMMTTNLTHGRPYRIPFETRQFFFVESEMRRLFPPRVVDRMMEGSPQSLSKGGKETLHAFPPRDRLPVVVVTRMSLSFPVLLDAVPLWAIDFARKGGPAVERCWFSDGGITSNFPVHFFDAPLPRRPTFAINLAEWTTRYHDEGQTIYVPRTNLSGIREWWHPVHTLPQFITAIVKTMQNWRDNMLLHLPGQRDRIAHVLLAPNEGGLNLTMEASTIRSIAARGTEAARTLRAHFGEAPPKGVTLTWPNHKWVRFLAFMPALEEALEKWARAFPDPTAAPPFDELLSGAVSLPSYKISPTERAAMETASQAFLEYIRQNLAARPFRSPTKCPKPEPILRAMPRE